MDVRPVRPTDVPLALTLSLDDRAHLVRGPDSPARNSFVRTLARAAIPLCLPGRAWLARDANSVALLEAVPRRYVIGWDVVRLVVHGEHNAVLGPVVQAAVDHLRARGVPRLFARCSEAASEELRMVAFHPLARELVLLSPGGLVDADDAPLPNGSRYRMPQDAWALHQLESEITPPLVRQLEGMTSVEWSHKLRAMSEIVVERDGRIVCWVGWGAPLGHDLRRIGLLVHPAERQVAIQLLHHVISRSPEHRFLARVREYDGEALNAFRDVGFVIADEEVVMVKHARVELARFAKPRIQAVQIPTAHIIHQRWMRGRTARKAASAPGRGNH
jgi:hypothetical protein